MHIMLDLETLGLTPNTVVTQIGWATFNLEPTIGERETAGGIIGSGCIYLDPEQQIAQGREISWSTMKWWMEQEEAARKKMTNAVYSGVRYGLIALSEKFSTWPIEGVWSNGPSFDQAILENLMRDYQHDIPWKYNAGRDFRTMKMLCPKVEAVKPTVAHDAESDAIAQAQFVQKCIACWKLFPNGLSF